MNPRYPLRKEAEAGLFDRLQEECAEVIKIVSKIKRFGLLSYHPDDPLIDNRCLLANEIDDLNAVIKELKVRGIL